MVDDDRPQAASRGGDLPGDTPFLPAAKQSWTHRIVPVAEHIPGYRGAWLGRDALAGITVAALALPAAMAYGELAGLSPVIGLYTLLLPAVAYAVFGSSRQVIVGPEGAIAAMVGAALIPMTPDPAERASLAALLALLVGVAYLVALLARLGWIADYLSRPVLIGYMNGVAIVMIIGQLSKVFGLSVAADTPVDQIREMVREIDQVSWPTVLVGGVCLTLLLVTRWLAPKIPAPLIVVVMAIIASAAFGLAGHGVAVVGEIPAGLPSVRLPDLHLTSILELAPVAIGIFFVSFSDEILVARSFAGRHGQHIRPAAELTAMGAASLAAAVSQGMPVGASGSRTAVNDQMRGRTQVAGLLAACVVALVLLFLTAPMQYLPKATLGAVIVVASIGLIEPAAWRGLARVSKTEVVIAAITMIGVIVIGVLPALLLAIALAVIDVIRRSATPHDAVLGWVERLGRHADVRMHPSARVTPGVLIYRLDDRLFFANATYVQGRIREAVAGAPQLPHWFVFDAEGLSHVDATGTDALIELIESLRKQSITMVFARLKDPVADRLRKAGIFDLIGEEHSYPTVRAAVDAAPKFAE